MKKFVTLIIVAMSSPLAFGWGQSGHRIVGHIAEKFMTPEALYKSRNILAGQSLDRASTWPDEIRSDPTTYSYTFNWHFTDWADDATEHDHTHETDNSGQLLTSLNKQLVVLSSKTATNEEKAFALKFITHLTGDLHQPLHVGNGIDAGGNFCKVNYFGQTTNLHKIWDDGMIESTDLSYTEMAKFITETVTASEVESIKNGDAVSWARESKDIRQMIYPAEVGEARSSGLKKYCEKNTVPSDIPKIGFEYNYKFLPVVERRLLEAGIRLATILNQALKN